MLISIIQLLLLEFLSDEFCAILTLISRDFNVYFAPVVYNWHCTFIIPFTGFKYIGEFPSKNHVFSLLWTVFLYEIYFPIFIVTINMVIMDQNRNIEIHYYETYSSTETDLMTDWVNY